MRAIKTAALTIFIFFYYEDRRLASGNLKKTPCNWMLFVYALSIFGIDKNVEMLLSLVPHLERNASHLRIKSKSILRLAEAALWEADISSYIQIRKYITPSIMQNKRVLDYASTLDKYYLWLTGEGDPPSFDGIYDGFSHFRSPIALMKAISYLHQHNIDQFRSNFAFAAHKPVKGSKTSIKLKLQANKYSNTAPTLNELRYMLTMPDITETL